MRNSLSIAGSASFAGSVAHGGSLAVGGGEVALLDESVEGFNLVEGGGAAVVFARGGGGLDVVFADVVGVGEDFADSP